MDDEQQQQHGSNNGHRHLAIINAKQEEELLPSFGRTLNAVSSISIVKQSFIYIAMSHSAGQQAGSQPQGEKKRLVTVN
jgi:hypothetical protein